MKLSLKLSANHSESPKLTLSCLGPGRVAVERWLSCRFIVGFLTSEVFASYVVAHWLFFLATVPHLLIWDTMSWQFLLGLLDRLQPSVGCCTWCMSLPVRLPEAASLRENGECPLKIAGNQKFSQVNKWICLVETGSTTSLIFLLPSFSWRCSEHHGKLLPFIIQCFSFGMATWQKVQVNRQAYKIQCPFQCHLLNFLWSFFLRK